MEGKDLDTFRHSSSDFNKYCEIVWSQKLYFNYLWMALSSHLPIACSSVGWQVWKVMAGNRLWPKAMVSIFFKAAQPFSNETLCRTPIYKPGKIGAVFFSAPKFLSSLPPTFPKKPKCHPACFLPGVKTDGSKFLTFNQCLWMSRTTWGRWWVLTYCALCNHTCILLLFTCWITDAILQHLY